MQFDGRDGALWQAYQKEHRDFQVRCTKVGCIVALVLMPCACTLDYLIYPHLLKPFLAARILCDLIVIPVFLLLFTERGRKWVRWLGMAGGLTPSLGIAWMIYLTEGVRSPFYAGLRLRARLLPAGLRVSCPWRSASQPVRQQGDLHRHDLDGLYRGQPLHDSPSSA
jgi:hypothetical protein